MDSQLFSAVERSATVLTASKRLSRSLIASYSEYQRDQGRSVWRTPRILALGGWLEQCWRDWVLAGTGDAPVLLNKVQEAALWESIVWESIIRESPGGRSLLRVPETAREAMKAWALLHAYRLPFNAGAFSVSDDCEAFYEWACEFERRRDANGWMEEAQLADVVTGLVRDPGPVIFAGFDELTPQQQDLLDAVRGSMYASTTYATSTPRACAFRDTNDEMAHAAAWARRRLEANPEARIGVVVPNIGAMRSKLERAFEEVLPGAFHISLGPALRDRPMVHAALLLLELAKGAVEMERMGMILRSPYWKGAEAERSRRALVDVALRKQGQSPVPSDAVPSLAKALGGYENEVQSPSEWGRTFSRLLRQAGWPGDRALNSEEFQAREAWNKLLSAFATLDAVIARLDLHGAWERLNSLAANTEFAVEDQGEPVQIAGLFEASGLRFDHLWVLGLHDEEMPPPAQPNPFLPLGMQRDRGLPHSSAQRELEFNRQLLARLWASAPEVVFSYPQWEGDQARSPSPLIQVGTAAPEPQVPRWMDMIRASAAWETIEDRLAPPLPVGTEQRGGTRVLQDMAACPFKAFARNRLGARELENADLGLNAREKGTGVHKVLELIWAEIKTHANLLALDESQLQELIAANIDKAPLADRLGVHLERRRLQRLLTEWFEIEKSRPPFRVLEREEERTVTIGNLQVSTRIDRVDELPDGRRIIIDYKTSDVKGSAWSGERLAEPQVPLYCISTAEPIAGAAFAQIRAGGVLLKGVSQNSELGRIKPMDVPPIALPELMEDWRAALNQLGSRFRTGIADVDPKEKSTCDYCRVTALCRIHDHA